MNLMGVFFVISEKFAIQKNKANREGKMKKLVRSRKNKMIAGICAGIADYFNLDPTLVRIVYVLVSIFSIAFPGILVYIILWVIIPEANSE